MSYSGQVRWFDGSGAQVSVLSDGPGRWFAVLVSDAVWAGGQLGASPYDAADKLAKALASELAPGERVALSDAGGVALQRGAAAAAPLPAAKAAPVAAPAPAAKPAPVPAAKPVAPPPPAAAAPPPPRPAPAAPAPPPAPAAVAPPSPRPAAPAAPPPPPPLA